MDAPTNVSFPIGSLASDGPGGATAKASASPAGQTQGVQRYKALDGLRGIAATLVLLFHIRWTTHFSDLVLIKNGYLSVDLFFILSGFILTTTYGSSICRPSDVGLFLRRRWFRIYPLHLFVLATLVALEFGKVGVAAVSSYHFSQPPFTGMNSVSALAQNAFLLHGLGLTGGLTWNFPSWTISSEYLVYVVFALATWMGFLRLRLFLPACASLGLLAYVFLAQTYGSLNLTDNGLGFLRCLAGFALGACIARSGDHWPRLLDFLGIPLALVAVAILASQSSAAVFVIVPIFAALVSVLQTDKGWVARQLSRGPIQHLGRLSFSVYMIHAPVLTVLELALRRRFPTTEEARIVMDPWLGDVLALAFFAVCLALAQATYSWIEEPGRRAGANGLSRPAFLRSWSASILNRREGGALQKIAGSAWRRRAAPE